MFPRACLPCCLHLPGQVRQVAVLCSLVWPTQDVFKLFDRVILLAQGKVIFHGAREEVAPYLCSLG